VRPPGFALNNRTSAAVDRREWKAASRDALIQCDRCGAIGSARLNGRGRVASVNLPARPGRTWRHSDCGGALVAFDIAVPDA